MSTDKAKHLSTLWSYMVKILPEAVADGQVVDARLFTMTDGLLPMWVMETEDLWQRMTGSEKTAVFVNDDEALLGVALESMPNMTPADFLPCIYGAACRCYNGENLQLDPLILKFNSRFSSLSPSVVPSVSQDLKI